MPFICIDDVCDLLSLIYQANESIMLLPVSGWDKNKPEIDECWRARIFVHDRRAAHRALPIPLQDTLPDCLVVRVIRQACYDSFTGRQAKPGSSSIVTMSSCERL